MREDVRQRIDEVWQQWYEMTPEQRRKMREMQAKAWQMTGEQLAKVMGLVKDENGVWVRKPREAK